jgi:PHD/YefM family antitoxin component YafN of YafNO toxin-antitoxin module
MEIPMPINLSSSRVQQNFGEVMDRALISGDVVVERYGVPRVAIISYERYQQLMLAEREMLRARLQQASAAASARAAHLSNAEVDMMIEEARSQIGKEH